jgi:hypothetical protein
LSLESAKLRTIALLARCKKHSDRLEAARLGFIALGPIDAASLDNPAQEIADRVDLLLLAYMRLQDALGGRLFPALLEAGGELSVESSFADRLNALERLRIIDSAEAWMELRAIRNQMAHDYPDPVVRLQILNRAVETIAELRRAVVAAKAFATDRLKWKI